ncbi:acetylglutamate kinase [Chitinophaga pendula]|uniref:acetylglutamate kinase n=1 Tax=Chitinophaga TaxID=79328 RepID=UPI000BAEB076|nr:MULTISPECIES: acetylglutamate kinase [Chitinophaga]ASZ14343.1 acetylglutamate kinase [Chitinophaga sp. MD30]UCJ08007.1 acetylglutamate kinase [Chitinophaga pendula]
MSISDNNQREQLFVIKVGGNVIDNPALLQSFLADFAKVPGNKLLIHGGGKIATRIGDKLGIESKYVDGRRITDADTIDVVTMVYGGLVNKQLVAKLQALGCNAIGLTGADANIIPAAKRPVKEIDYGFVGDVLPAAMNVAGLQAIVRAGLIPVFASLTHDGKGQMLNTNADTIAASLAIALSASYQVRLIYCFEKKGVLSDAADDNAVINLIDRNSYEQLKEEKVLTDGILPKLENAFEAITSGVNEVLIGHAADILSNTSGTVSGTLIR